MGVYLKVKERKKERRRGSDKRGKVGMWKGKG